MAKSFKTQTNPTFKATVSIPRVGADPMKVGFTFRAFDRHGLAEIFDRWKEQNMALLREAEEAADQGAEFTLAQWAKKEVAIQASQVKDIVVGWGFDDDFTDENIQELVSMSVSVTDAIVEQYNEAYNRARSGN